MALQGLKTLDAELPVMLGGVEHDAGGSAEGPCPACGAGVEHPGLTVEIGDQAVAVPIDNCAGMRETATQTLVAIPGGDLVAVDDCQRPAKQLQVFLLG
jgi:hypothetical protein